MDRFQYLSSPSICNVISSFRSSNHGGIIDNIMTMKRESKFEFIHDNVIPGQGKEKVYIFKMLIEGPRSEVDFVKRMQLAGVRYFNSQQALRLFLTFESIQEVW